MVSTLHTNDAATTVTRLIAMGIPNFLVAEATSLVVAQRLVKKNCSSCLTDVTVPEDTLLSLGVPKEELLEYQNLKKGEGCSACNYTGLAGRVAVYEMLPISSAVKDSIFKNESPLNIKRRAMAEDGMLTLRQSALLKLKRGLVSAEQVLAATVADDI